MTQTPDLTVLRAAALYVGALLGPGLLLLPGLAAGIAGPASILAWAGLLGLSGLLSVIFTALGRLHPGASGVQGYVAAAFGTRAGRATAWCFLAGVIAGAPIVCLVGAQYISAEAGLGPRATIAVSGALLALVLAVTLGGVRAAAVVQVGLVALLLGVVAAAVIGGAPHASAANWTPFAPHGWAAVGSAASVLMLSFVGWEAAASLTPRLPDPQRQLHRVMALAFAATTVIYLSLAAVTIGVLGTGADTTVPLASLLETAVGPTGRLLAAGAAILLTLGCTNTYLTGAATLAGELRPTSGAAKHGFPRWLVTAVVGTGLAMFGVAATGQVSTSALVQLATCCFLLVYLGCTVAAVRILHGTARVASGVAVVVLLGILGFSGLAVVPAVAIALVGSWLPTFRPLVRVIHRRAGSEPFSRVLRWTGRACCRASWRVCSSRPSPPRSACPGRCSCSPFS